MWPARNLQAQMAHKVPQAPKANPALPVRQGPRVQTAPKVKQAPPAWQGGPAPEIQRSLAERCGGDAAEETARSVGAIALKACAAVLERLAATDPATGPRVLDFDLSLDDPTTCLRLDAATLRALALVDDDSAGDHEVMARMRSLFGEGDPELASCDIVLCSFETL